MAIRSRRASLSARLVPFVALLVATAASAAAPERTLLAQPPRAITDIQLTDQDNKPRRLSDLRGTPLLVFFGFSHCPAICPAALQQLRQLERQHGTELGGTRIVIISVDGERDTPAVMRDWLKPVSAHFVGLTGAPARVRDLASSFSAAFYKTPGKTADQYLVEHNSQIFLVDAQGRLRATFFNAPVPAMLQVTRAVATES
jgi:protein SCO1